MDIKKRWTKGSECNHTMGALHIQTVKGEQQELCLIVI